MAGLMNKLHWFWARLDDRVGLAGWIAALLLGMVLLYGFYVFLPSQYALSALKLNVVAPEKTQQTVYIAKSPADQMFAMMPSIDVTTSSIQTLFDVADIQGITINEVVYKDEHKQGENVIRYDMTFSVVASYPAIKAFVVDTLAELPTLALEQLNFERDDINSDITSAHLRFTLYMVQ
jgi:hypothetical protein